MKRVYIRAAPDVWSLYLNRMSSGLVYLWCGDRWSEAQSADSHRLCWSFGGSTRGQLRAKYEAWAHDFETRHGFSDHGTLVCVYKQDGGRHLLSVFWVGATHYAVGEDAEEGMPEDGTRVTVTGAPWRMRKPRTLWVRLGKGDWVV